MQVQSPLGENEVHRSFLLQFQIQRITTHDHSKVKLSEA
jgi:hypothetical protein